MKISQASLIRFTAAGVLWLFRIFVLSISSYTLSMVIYNPTFIDSIDWYSQDYFPVMSARIRKMTRLWPPFDYPFIWVLHSCALFLIYGRFAKEENLLESFRRVNLFKQNPTPFQNFFISFCLCLFITISEFQMLMPMIRLSEIHPVVIFMDFCYMFQVSVMAKIIMKSTSFTLYLNMKNE